MPYLGTMVASAVFAVIFAAISGLFALADVTPNPVSQRWLAQADSSVEFKAWIFKTVIVLCANVLQGIHNVQSLLILIAAGWLAYTYLRWVRLHVVAAYLSSGGILTSDQSTMLATD
jgi:hypothetical protein